METIEASPRFLALLDELHLFQLPPRSRILPGEIIAGRIKANLHIAASAQSVASPPAPIGAIVARIVLQAPARDRLTYAEIVEANAPPKVAKAPRKPVEPGKKAGRPRNAPKPTRVPKPRSAEAIASAAAKVRAQRQARIDEVLPLVADARANGCLLLTEICEYLDRVGHKPQRGGKWSKTTLINILGDQTHDVRKSRAAAFTRLIEQARSQGALTNQKIAEWLNLNGHRSANGRQWTRANVSRFINLTTETE